jgi:hydrogen peroxide-dependent heme synthase
MKPADRDKQTAREFPAAPLTLEGSSLLHQFFRLRRGEWNRLDDRQRTAITGKASAYFAEQDAGTTAIFQELGHKGDLIVVHFRSSFEDLGEAQTQLARLDLSEFLEPTYSYLSVVEIGLYAASVRLYGELAERELTPHSPEWNIAVAAELSDQRVRLAARLTPAIPNRRHLCFYPMNKRREGNDNWYSQPIGERQRMMHEHGQIGRRYAGQITQIISGSIGLDDWEWGVDLFADDPMVFKHLVYEMRFDESSARFAEFGPFYFGIRLEPDELTRIL